MTESLEQFYLFRHALVRDAAYALFPPQERVELHRHAIGGFELLYPAELAAHSEELLQHARAALALGAEKELQALEHHYLKLAADYCQRTWRIDDEFAHLQQLEDHPLSSAAERAEFMVRRTHYLIERSGLHDAVKLAERAIEVAEGSGATDCRLAAMFLRYRARYEGGQVESPNELDQLLQDLGKGGVSEPLMQAHIECGITRERDGKPDEAETEFNRALEIAIELGNPDSEAECLFERGTMFVRSRRHTEAEADLRAAMELVEKSGNRRLQTQGLNRLAIMLVESNRWKEAVAIYERSRDLAHAIGAQSSETTISNNLANLNYFFLGNLTSAEQVYLRSVEFFRERNDVHSISHASGVLGLMYVTAGEFDNARACFERVRSHAQLQNDRVMEAKAYMGLAMSTGDRTDIHERIAAYRIAIEKLRVTPSRSNLTRTWTELADALLDAGFVDAANEAFTIAKQQAEIERGRGMILPSLTRRSLLVGDDGPKMLAQYEATVSVDEPPQTKLSQTLLYRFMSAASTGAGLSRLIALRDGMRAVADSFEVARYLTANQALALADATVAAHQNGESALWRGLALGALPPGLARAVQHPERKQPLLRELLSGLDELVGPTANS
ncbi:MAG: tetratricopeptide repeat protein [Planctomycetes bacterium]|nr:tetratricopeptide repeat protein [Planctomycetota bacterium]